MACWSQLPREILSMVLKVLIEDRTDLPCYAPVCREWQQKVERKSFHELQVTPSRLPGLAKIAPSRRHFLECIKYSISLQEYACPQCDSLASREWMDTDRGIVESGLAALFQTLCTWKSAERRLILDISISSPSDAEHYFKECRPDDISGSAKDEPLIHDPRHGWRKGRQTMLPPWAALVTVFETIYLTRELWQRMPAVTAITDLQIRRENRRQLEPRFIKRLLTYLPMLQTVCYEPWRKWSPAEQEEADMFYPVLLRSLKTYKLRRLVIFEDFDDDYVRTPLSCPIPAPDNIIQPERVRTADPAVGGALAQASRGLEVLSASFLVDAIDFFLACKPKWIWHELTSLALTSRALAPSDVENDDIDDLLQKAAKFAATRAPKLGTLVLWNYDGFNASAFIYQAARLERQAVITWRATWDKPLRSTTIQSWEMVISQHDSQELSVVTEGLNVDTIDVSRADTIEEMKLPAEVLHPQSLGQILEEATHRVYPLSFIDRTWPRSR